MVGKWLVVLPLLVEFNRVTLQPISVEDSGPRARLLDPRDCCPCLDYTKEVPGAKAYDSLSDGFIWDDCPCRARVDDAEASASMLLPALRAIQPFVRKPDQKTEPKPLLQPEVGLASSVLETLRQATDEEYRDALARDSARSAAQFMESVLDSADDTLLETPNNKVRIILNTKEDDMDDNLPEPSHIQETRCIHSPLRSVNENRQLKMSRPTPIMGISWEPRRKLKNKSILRSNILDMDNGIGASNIQERVTSPSLDHNIDNVNSKTNPTLISLLRHNNLETAEDHSPQALEKKIDDGFNLSQKVRPNIHLKLRELIDHLEVITKKEKLNVPIIDLSKYISTTTRMPPLKFKSVEKPIFDNKPIFIKDLFKLKDVELISQNTPSANAAVGKTPYSNLKLQLQNSNVDPNIDTCIEGNDNLAPIINENMKNSIDPMFSEYIDSEISPTNSKSIFEPKPNEMDKDIKQNILPIQCMIGSEKNGMVSVPIDPHTKGPINFDYSDIKIKENSNKGPLLSDNCNTVTENSLTSQLPNNGDEEPYNNGLLKGKAQKLEGSKDILNKGSNDNVFQIELLEDFDTPLEFDNSSFISNSDLKDNKNIQNNFIKNENTLIDSVADTSNKYFQIGNQNNGIPNVSQGLLKNDYCNFQQNFAKKSNFVSEDEQSMEKSEEIYSMQEESTDSDMGLLTSNGRDISSDINVDPSQVSFKDLQTMSDSILSLSEYGPLTEGNENTKSNINENVNQINNDCDILKTAFSTPISERRFEKIDTEYLEPTLNDYNKLNEALNLSSEEDVCKSLIFDDKPIDINDGDIKKTINSNKNNYEMQAEASELESTTNTKCKSYNIENDKKANVITKFPADVNDTVLKHSDFLNNLKSKLESLFSTTEKVITGDIVNSSDDNVNESSNINPKVTKLDKFNNFNKLEHRPQTSLFRGTSPPKLPVMTLKPPKYEDHPQRSNSYNLLKFPLEKSGLFEDTLDPISSFSALSDKFRSHTENTIQSVKETLESTLKNSPSFRLSRPTDTIDTHDILESISNRRDDMKEKLEALHLDLNDRFESFQQGILDHFNLPTEGSSEFQDGRSNGGLKESYAPFRKELSLPEALKFRNINEERFNLPLSVDGLKNSKSVKPTLKPSKIPSTSDVANMPRNSNRKSSLQNSILYAVTTDIPSFIPRPKVLKTNIDPTPILTSETISKGRSTKIPILSEVAKRKSINLDGLLKSGRTSKLSEEPSSLPTSSSTINTPVKSFKTNTEKFNKEMNKFRKASLQRDQNQKPRNEFSKSDESLNIRNLMDNDRQLANKQESRLGRMRERKPSIGSNTKDELIVSPTTHTETLHPSDNDRIRLVEPMKENVPYKCKLICYKDT